MSERSDPGAESNYSLYCLYNFLFLFL